MGDFKQSRTKVPNLTISGDLTVEGDTTTVSSTNTVITDKRIELGNGTTGTPAADAGIIIERGDEDNAIFAWDESADSFVVGTMYVVIQNHNNLVKTYLSYSVRCPQLFHDLYDRNHGLNNSFLFSNKVGLNKCMW